MIVIHDPNEAGVFSLVVEDEADRLLLDALDQHRSAVLNGVKRQALAGGGYANHIAVLHVGPQRASWQSADADRQTGRAVRQLLSLLLGEKANHAVASTDAANPEPQVQPVAVPVKLQLVTDAADQRIGQLQVGVNVVGGTHGKAPSVVDFGIVDEGGAA